jgi:hypothetical protein
MTAAIRASTAHTGSSASPNSAMALDIPAIDSIATRTCGSVTLGVLSLARAFRRFDVDDIRP